MSSEQSSDAGPHNCDECGVRIEPLADDGFTEYARQVAAYVDHLSEEHPDHDLLDEPEGFL
ncbi:hypothetical protein [Haloparvum sedimenti]|uniref:hypothetical protein n=1 Tax=Haloparvum sedimenti TaxID=1678448 RepID=UPI000F7AE5AF|nr:hypothetical protein [Haloparvum sedimenti]